MVQGWINDPPVTVEPFQFSSRYVGVANEWSNKDPEQTLEDREQTTIDRGLEFGFYPSQLNKPNPDKPEIRNTKQIRKFKYLKRDKNGGKSESDKKIEFVLNLCE